MRKDFTHIEQYREPMPITGQIAPGMAAGAFRIPHHEEHERRRYDTRYFVICCSAEFCENHVPFDHVSVHVRYYPRGCGVTQRTPTWDEMCHIKGLFFEREECVVQYHPPESLHINFMPHVLHLWRSAVAPCPMPPSFAV